MRQNKFSMSSFSILLCMYHQWKIKGLRIVYMCVGGAYIQNGEFKEFTGEGPNIFEQKKF